MDAQPPEEEDAGGGWIMTFADLMSLLMCFFVLLLSFAELDVMKYKAIAGSLKLAFGVQRELKAIEVPMGTSIVAQEFSSAAPDPSVINEVKQKTDDEEKQSLEFTDALVDDVDGTDPDQPAGAPNIEQQLKEAKATADAERLTEALLDEIEKGMIEIYAEGAAVLIRIQEKGSFPSGKAKFDPAFNAVIAKLRDELNDIGGTIAVAGHTDDIPIRTQLYRSNWDLSSARAVSVVHALLEDSDLSPSRFVAEGHGEAHPLVDNDSREGRAKNRRVEITIRQDPPASEDSGVQEPESATREDEHQPTEVLAQLDTPEEAAKPSEEQAPFSQSNVFPERPVGKKGTRIDVIRDGIRSRAQ